MTASFREIDYSLRPCKHAERRMLGEIFRRLRPFQPVEDYIYVGFGSVWFIDFALFHRSLGIKEMISIERQAQAKERIDSNKPFASVTVEYNHSSAVLPKLEWNKRHFLWLDYDGTIDRDIMLDVRSVAQRARSGTVLAISVQCQKAPQVNDAEEDPGGPSAFERFVDTFGADRIGNKASATDLYGWNFGKLSRRIILQEIESVLVSHNSGLEYGEVTFFKPICSFEYEDGAKMTTVVGIFVSRADTFLFESCRFDDLDFIKEQGKPVRIPFPKITAREARLIEQTLPWAPGTTQQVGAIPASDTKGFASFYRYWPNYAVLEN